MYQPCNDNSECDFAAELLRIDHVNSILNKSPSYLKVVDVVGTLTSFCAHLISNINIAYNRAVCWGGTGGWTGQRTQLPNTKLQWNVMKLYTNTMSTLALFKDGTVIGWQGSVLNYGGSSSDQSKRVGGYPKDVVQVIPSKSAWAVMDIYGHVWTFGNCEDAANAPLWIENPFHDYARLKDLIPWEEMFRGVIQVKTAYMKNAFAILKPSLEENRGYRVAGSWGHTDALMSSQLQTLLSNDVHSLYSNAWSFAALMTTGKIAVWGDNTKGGNIDGESASLLESVSANVIKVFFTLESFAVLKIDGSIIPWGGDGGTISVVQGGNSGTNMVTIGSDFTGSKKRLNNCPLLKDGFCKICTDTKTKNATCTKIVCGTNKYNVDGVFENGCEEGCDVVAGGVCKACAEAKETCTEVLCNENNFNIDGNANNGCEMGCDLITINSGTCVACSDETTCTSILCDANKFNTDNDIENGCEEGCDVVAGGVCEACAEAKETCTEVLCAENNFNVDGNANNGCEMGCDLITINGGTCVACSDETTCTSILCDANKFNTDNDIENGCEDGCEVTQVIDGICTACSDASTCTAFTLDQQKMSDIEAEKINLTNTVTILTSESNILVIERNKLLVNTSSLTLQRNTCQNEKRTVELKCQENKTKLKDEMALVEGAKILIENDNAALASEKTVLLEEKTVLIEEKTVLLEEKTVLLEEKRILAEEKNTFMKGEQNKQKELELSINTVSSLQEKIIELTEKLEKATTIDTTTTITTATTTKSATEKSSSIDTKEDKDTAQRTSTTDIVGVPSPAALKCGIAECDTLLVAQTGWDSGSMLVFGFGFFVYIVVLTLAMVVILVNRYKVKQKDQKLKERGGGGGVKVQPKLSSSPEQSESQRRLAQRLNGEARPVQEELPSITRASRRRSRNVEAAMVTGGLEHL